MCSRLDIHEDLVVNTVQRTITLVDPPFTDQGETSKPPAKMIGWDSGPGLLPAGKGIRPGTCLRILTAVVYRERVPGF